MSNPIQNMLSGENAFYKAADHDSSTRSKLASTKAPAPIYTYNTENKVWRVAKQIFAIIIFPVGLYQLAHRLIGKYLVVPAALICNNQQISQQRPAMASDPEWKVKRIALKVDGYVIDAAIIGKADTLNNGRWVLASNGNGEFYEHKLLDPSFKSILSELEGNTIVFNYPGVGSSSGMPNRKTIAKAYRAMLTFLEDKENGIGANEIIGYGHSLGGGAQGDGLRTHKLKDDVKYVFVKSRTFSDIGTQTYYMMANAAVNISTKPGAKPKTPEQKHAEEKAFQFWGRIARLAVRFFGWNMSSVESSKKLQAPEIIMQTVKGVNGQDASRDISGSPVDITHDDVIPAEASLAKHLLEDGSCPKENKYFMGIPDRHNGDRLNGSLANTKPLTDKIKEMLGNSRSAAAV